MIFIVSIIIAFSFILSAVFIGFTPNVARLVDSDILREVFDNAAVEAIQYGNLYRRAGIIDTNTTTTMPENATIVSRFTYTVDSEENTINLVNITSDITVIKNSTTGVEDVTVSVDK